MNAKIITFGLLLVLALYGMNTVLAQDTSDEPIVNENEAPCEDPLYDGSGYNGTSHDGERSGNQRGDMDGSKTQLKSQLRDGSEAGGMYGTKA